MRNDTMRWRSPSVDTQSWMLNGAMLQRVTGLRQSLVSGAGVVGDATVGWPDVAQGNAYAFAIRRDRAIQVGGPGRDAGWDPDAQTATSDVSDLYAVFDLFGDTAFDILRRGTELSLKTPSRGTARSLFGLPVFLYRIDTPVRFRIHVEHGFGEALIQYIETVSSQL